MNTLNALSLSLLALVPVTAQTTGRQLYEFPNAQADGRFGAAIATLGDVNRDGVRDFFVSDPDDLGYQGVVTIFSGATGFPVRHLRPPRGTLFFGRAAAGVGDVNQDRIPDLLIASTSAIRLCSGANGTVLRTFNVTARAVAGPGDWDADGVPDLAWLDSAGVRVVSGRDGTALANLTAGGSELVAIGSDLVLAGSGVAYYSRGATTPRWSRPGYGSVASAGDLDRDGAADVAAVSASATDVLSGRTGSLLRRFPHGERAVGGQDFNLDGVVDIVVADSNDRTVTRGAGAVRVYSGRDGAFLFANFGQDSDARCGIGVATHPGAGVPARPAVLVAVRGRTNNGQRRGSVRAIASPRAGEVDGYFRPFGGACAVSDRIRPGLGLPKIGASYTFYFHNNSRPMGMFNILVIGTSNTTWNGQPLPIPLPGSSCSLLVDPRAVRLINPTVTRVSLNVPSDLSLVRRSLFVQAFSISSRISAASDAAEMRIGN